MQDPAQYRSVIIGTVIAITLLAVAGAGWYFFSATSSNPAVQETPTTQGAPEVTNLMQATTEAKRYPLPKSKVTPAYSAIFNATVNEMTALSNTYRNQMLPLGAQAQTLIKNKDYQSLQNLGQQIQAINAGQEKRLTIISADLDNLAIASKSLTDQETIRLTDDFITTGKTMVEKLASYSSLIDAMIAGNVTAQSETSAETITKELTSVTTDFFASSRKLFNYFSATIASDTKAYLAAHPEAATTTIH